LLIIMMLIAPLLQAGVQLTLPKAVNTVEKPDTAGQTTVYVDVQGNLFVNTLPVGEDEVIPRLKEVLDQQSEKLVYLKGDHGARYSDIMKMMDALRGAQIETVALITDKPGGN
jgi:biopolymer transport protein ExbD